MKLLTIKNKPVTERILERRAQFFSNIDSLTENQIQILSNKWHKIANRYSVYISKIIVCSLEN